MIQLRCLSRVELILSLLSLRPTRRQTFFYYELIEFNFGHATSWEKSFLSRINTVNLPVLFVET